VINYYADLGEGLIDCADLEQCDIWDKKKIKARKMHTCLECKHPIVPGELYWRVKYLYEGAWDTDRFCLCCENARCHLAAVAGAGMCILTGTLWDTAGWMVQEGLVTKEELEQAKMGGEE